MKKIIFTFVAMLMPIMPLMAGIKVYYTYVNGLYYDFNSNGTASVTGEFRYTDGSNEYSTNNYSGDVVIPSTVTYKNRTYSVTRIHNWAFWGCTNLNSVTIPSSIKSIGSEAFYRCGKLNYINIMDIAAWCNVENDYSGLSFSHLYLNGVEIKDLFIPNSVKSIGDFAFNGCSGLTSVTFHNDINSIGIYAFSNCSGLSSVTIPNSVTSIGHCAFEGCSGMTTVTIGNGVESIGYYAFEDCKCLTTIIVEGNNMYFDSRNDCNAIIETSSNTLVQGCKSTIIPNSVTSIGGSAFRNCSGLTSITIPNSVTTIGEYSFSGCNSLTSIVIPNSVTSIGDNPFNYCSGLQFICVVSEKYPSTQSMGNTTCQYIMPQKAFDGGIPNDIIHYATYSDKPMYIRVKSKTATSAVLELRPVDTNNGGLKGNSYSVKLQGLAPAASIKGVWKVDPFGYGKVRLPNDKTMSLTMSVQAAKAVSTTKARLSATVNEANDDKRYGFEWLRYDAPDNMTPNRVSAPLYDGQIVGTLSNLNPDIYYKYRPFYKADDGTIIRGEWEAFITGDANVFFEPEVHTNEPAALTKDGAQLSGVWVEGTEDIQEKGFEYWLKNSSTRPVSATRGSDITAVIVKGNNTSITLEGLEAGTEYVYRSYLRTASGTVYGEEKTFKTPLPGDANNDGKINVADIVEINNAKAGNPSASFNMTNADTDGDGSLTEADITAIVNIIMK